MKDTQAVRRKLKADIDNLECGMDRVAEKMACSVQNLKKILSATDGRKSKLETFERIKTAIKECQQAEAQREQALLA